VLTCEGHGAAGADPVHAIAHSCNSFFYQAAAGLGADGLQRAYRCFGWTGDESDEPVYQLRVAGVEMVGRARAATGAHVLERRAIGYGVDASALHVARAYAALATGVLPRIGLVLEDRSALTVPLDVAPADLEVVRDVLESCVTRGTASKIEGLAELGVLAKTGTAEISTTTRHNNAWFAGYLTRAEPTLAFAAVAYDVPDGQHGAEVAGELIASFLTAVYEDEALRAAYLPKAGR
jgi:cell division protein FtsI/penicillin-binding protein 2